MRTPCGGGGVLKTLSLEPLPASCGSQTSFEVHNQCFLSVTGSSPPCEAFGWLQPQPPSLSACYQWCSLPLLLSACPSNSRQSSLHNVCIGMAFTCSWQRPIAVTISPMCLRSAAAEPRDVACHGGQPSYKPLQPRDSV